MNDDPLLSVVETSSYLATAKGVLSDDERTAVVNMIADDPECGDLIVGGGGIRKVRFAIGARGKSGGTRVIYLYHNHSMPAFLLAVFAKNDKANLTRAEANALAVVAKQIIATYGV